MRRRALPGALLGAGLALSALALAGCAVAPVGPASADLLAGRLALRIEGEAPQSLAAGFELRGNAEAGEMLLSGPLGQVLAQASWAPGRAVLVAADGRRQFDDLDSLARGALGEPVPIAALFDWLRGRPWPGAPEAARRDGEAGFEQLGWRIGLANFASGAVDARRDAPPPLTLRIRLDRP